MPLNQAPNPPLAPAGQTGPTVTSGVASTGNTGTSLSSARADHAHAASVDSLRTPPYAATGTTATVDLALYDNLEWVLPTAPTMGETTVWWSTPTRQAYYVTLNVAYTSPNTNQRPKGRMFFKQPRSGQVTHQIRIPVPAWATGGVKGTVTTTPVDADYVPTGAPAYQSIVLLNPGAVPEQANSTNPGIYGQIFQVDFQPLYDSTTGQWTLVIGALSNAAGGGLKLGAAGTYVTGGGGGLATGLSLEAIGDVLLSGTTTANWLNAYAVSTFNVYATGIRFKDPASIPLLNVPKPSTNIPTYYVTDFLQSAELELILPTGEASVGFAFPSSYDRPRGTLTVRQPATGQQCTTLTFYCLNLTYSQATGGVRGITTAQDSTTLTTTLNSAFATIVRDALSPDLNPQRGAGAVTIYDFQYVTTDSLGQRYVLIRKRPALATTAGNLAGITQTADATSGQVLTVDSTGMQAWATLPSATVSNNGLMTTTQVSALSSALNTASAAVTSAATAQSTADALQIRTERAIEHQAIGSLKQVYTIASSSQNSMAAQPNAGGYPATIVAVGDAGKIAYAAPGRVMAATTAAGSYVGNFNDIAASSSLFVAVGATGQVQSSPDGITWTQRNTSGSNLNAIAYNGSIWVAVGDSGTIVGSTTGTSAFTSAGTSALSTANLVGIVWVPSVSKFFVTSADGRIQIGTVSSGISITWASAYTATGTSPVFTAKQTHYSSKFGFMAAGTSSTGFYLVQNATGGSTAGSFTQSTTVLTGWSNPLNVRFALLDQSIVIFDAQNYESYGLVYNAFPSAGPSLTTGRIISQLPLGGIRIARNLGGVLGFCGVLASGAGTVQLSSPWRPTLTGD